MGPGHESGYTQVAAHDAPIRHLAWIQDMNMLVTDIALPYPFTCLLVYHLRVAWGQKREQWAVRVPVVNGIVEAAGPGRGRCRKRDES